MHLVEGDIWVCGIAVLVNFLCGISVILILNCVIAVFSESAGWGISGVLVNDIWFKRNSFTRFPTLFWFDWFLIVWETVETSLIKDVVVEKCWRAYATPAIRKLFENVCLQSLALTKVSFNDFPLRYDRMGGSWNISFRYGWFWIRCHFPISKYSWRYVKPGGIVLQKAIFSFCAFVFVFKDLFSPKIHLGILCSLGVFWNSACFC